MQAPTIFAILSFAFAAAATALPPRDEPTVGPNGNAFCGNGQVISCCNTKSSSGGSGGLLGLGGVLDGVLGGDCNPLTIPIGKPWYPSYISNRTDSQIVGVAVPVSQACAGNQAACCTGSESVSTSVHHPGRTLTQ